LTERKKGLPLFCGQRQGIQRWPSGESAAGDDAVQVGVMQQLLAPGVQNGEKAELGS
jgi:hypothetical protein